MPNVANSSPVMGRFAPSPTGRLHAGNLFAAIVSWAWARRHGGRMVLRIEDLDPDRSKPEFVDAIMRDYERMGLTWDEGPFFQSDREEAYIEAFERLKRLGVVYPCFCSRADLHASSAPHRGDRFVYAGTCRRLDDAERKKRMAVRDPSWRLEVPDVAIEFEDVFQGRVNQRLSSECGDFIVRRSDGAFAYQLAVVLDDAEQGVTSIVRGHDLLSSTPQQIHLQNILGLPNPLYGHVPLVVNETGKRLSKRDRDAGIDELFDALKTPEAIVGRMAGLSGLMPDDTPISVEELSREADFGRLFGLETIVWH